MTLIDNMTPDQIRALFALCTRVDSGYLRTIANDDTEADDMRRALTVLTQNMRDQNALRQDIKLFD